MSKTERAGAPELSHTREEAEWLLACRLYEEMERLDPSTKEDKVDWKNLAQGQRDFYWLCVRAIFSERKLCSIAAR